MTNPYGVMLPPLAGPRVAVDLGARFYRTSKALYLSTWHGTNLECQAALDVGLGLVLTVLNTAPPERPPTDMAVYERGLTEVVEKYHPAILVIGNEMNAPQFYAGSVAQYGAQLAAAHSVCRTRGIPVADGGMVSTLVAGLVWTAYLEDGKLIEAEDFAARALTWQQRAMFQTPQGQAQLAIGKALLQVIREQALGHKGSAFVNFHYYIRNTQALTQVIAYLGRVTGLPVMTNEIGQLDDDPDWTTAALGALGAVDLGAAVWFAQDGTGAAGARGLCEVDGTLRPTGLAYQAYVKGLTGGQGDTHSRTV